MIKTSIERVARTRYMMPVVLALAVIAVVVNESTYQHSHAMLERGITTDRLRSYKAAINALGNAQKHEIGRWANNRVENSHLPFRRRERAMLRFRQMKSLQKFASVHANVYNHFNLERHLIDRQTYKTRRSAALAD